MFCFRYTNVENMYINIVNIYVYYYILSFTPLIKKSKINIYKRKEIPMYENILKFKIKWRIGYERDR